MEARASKLANIIESNASSKAQADLENLSDEEDKFSAVVRPSERSSAGSSSSSAAAGGGGGDGPAPGRDRHGLGSSAGDGRDFRDFGRGDRSSAIGPTSSSASVNSSGGKSSTLFWNRLPPF